MTIFDVSGVRKIEYDNQYMNTNRITCTYRIKTLEKRLDEASNGFEQKFGETSQHQIK